MTSKSESESRYLSAKIVVVGAGLMGCGIAQVFAQKGISTVICDPVEEARNTALDKIRANLDLQGLNHACLECIRIADDLASEVSNANFVIEAAPEKLPIKQKIFAELVVAAPSSCILASNTSVIPIRDIAAGLKTAERIIGTHWWNPPYLVPLVEVVQSDRSSETCVLNMMALLDYVGKKPIHVKKDVTGFVANRMQHALWREAVALINDGVCDPVTIDVAVKNSFGMRLPVLGPIENADLVGLDLTQDIHSVVLEDLNADRGPARVLINKVDAGELGMKTGSGFRNWTPEQADSVRKNLIQYLLKVTESPFPHSDN
ncbi:3-hydroxyacyl-CoA dehydrogenase family protein [Pseudomaricurvus alkylphenolicus]|uniref:3-hydroxyacyl-CoA dehydrogenase family protein n=1 Tax=Pseudomaricurvus alkylphenolicus TaxID=1306991 RepID=UPI0014245A41|nr:3-hydroxyacyl-CoA dehydrogenase NAD-binding domain-containing protein [Pseudomaricurvus alkylphenolicus]NIB40887.1 3-hydroxyacyl-CoA dehydrogenase family protein [Pseudomaricurvus alkylphenolicus]